MVIISTMTILELSTALGIVIAGIAGLLKASACKKIECGIVKGCICERDTIDIIEPPNLKSDFDIALKSKPINIPNGGKKKEGKENKDSQG